MKIVDVNFNIEDTENLVKDARYACDEAIQNVQDDIAEYNQYLKFEWTKMGRPFKKLEIEESIRVAEHAFDNLEKSINFLTALIQSRVDYIAKNNSQDQLYANYKLREEYNGLKNTAKKYNKLLAGYKDKHNKLLENANSLSDENQPGVE